MRKRFYIAFIAVFLIICCAPLVLMPFVKNEENLGNTADIAFPSIISEDNKLNQDFGTQFEGWFNEKIPFRSDLITADNTLKSELLGYSHNNVISGRNGYLYSDETIDDFIGKTKSEREIYNIARTLYIMQKYCNSYGAKFLFAAVPNKNTIEYENMPFGYKRGKTSTLDILQRRLDELSVNYVDLKSLLSNNEAQLYLKTDTHWNNLGALYGYNAIMDALEKPHKTYDGAEYSVRCDWSGDLSKMLYPSSPILCNQYYFDIEYSDFTFIKPRASMPKEDILENLMGDSESLDALIQTRNSTADGSLYISRDSFARALLPFLIDNYASIYMTRLRDFNLLNLQQEGYTDVVYEIAQRNIDTITDEPPMIYSPPARTTDKLEKISEADMTLKTENRQDGFYVSGILNGLVGECDDIYIEIESGGEKLLYDAFPIADKKLLGVDDKSEYGFSALIDSSKFDADDIHASVLIDKK